MPSAAQAPLHHVFRTTTYPDGMLRGIPTKIEIQIDSKT